MKGGRSKPYETPSTSVSQCIGLSGFISGSVRNARMNACGSASATSPVSTTTPRSLSGQSPPRPSTTELRATVRASATRCRCTIASRGWRALTTASLRERAQQEQPDQRPSDARSRRGPRWADAAAAPARTRPWRPTVHTAPIGADERTIRPRRIEARLHPRVVHAASPLPASQPVHAEPPRTARSLTRAGANTGSMTTAP